MHCGTRGLTGKGISRWIKAFSGSLSGLSSASAVSDGNCLCWLFVSIGVFWANRCQTKIFLLFRYESRLSCYLHSSVNIRTIIVNFKWWIIWQVKSISKLVAKQEEKINGHSHHLNYTFTCEGKPWITSVGPSGSPYSVSSKARLHLPLSSPLHPNEGFPQHLGTRCSGDLRWQAHEPLWKERN